jgi:hypothetical protein
MERWMHVPVTVALVEPPRRHFFFARHFHFISFQAAWMDQRL